MVTCHGSLLCLHVIFMAACFADLPSKRWLDRNAHGGVTELLANCVKHSSNGGQYITTVHCLAFDHPVVFFSYKFS